MSGNWAEQSIPDQHGRVAIVTGGNTGLGFETARMLAGHGAKVVLAVRDVAKGRQAAARIAGDIAVQALDLTSLDSVRRAASEIGAARIEHPFDLAATGYRILKDAKVTTRHDFAHIKERQAKA